MKKTVIIFVISALVLAGLALWALRGHLAGNAREILQAAIVLLVVGFAIFMGFSRLRSRRRGEPGEDELSRTLMTRASSLAYYISIYLWLFAMFVSDKTTLAAHSLIGAGIAAMAVVFVLCWLGLKIFGLKHD